jgi:UDP-N-acetylmuramoyl-tripeptide--D-alanyl-D-alanine ligase
VGGMMRLSELAQVLGASMLGEDVTFASVGIDSRNIQAGQLFVAILGEHFDGNDFVHDSVQQGAVAALVSKPVQGVSALLVEDTRLALGKMAAHWIQQFNLPVIALTGSNGKTTVKEMLASILVAHTGNADWVLATQGNLNNDLGMPLTALRLRQQHRYAVLEMGMNHPGEIHYMSLLARPDVALVNNVGAAHIGLLGSLQAIADAKGEIFDGLKANGIAVINADDAFAPQWLKQTVAHQQMTFALHHDADVTAKFELQSGASQIQLHTPQGNIDVRLPIAGAHNVANALAATALALAVQVPLTAIAQGLQAYSGIAGRLRYLAGINGVTLIDDSYNANPTSMRAAIDVLVQQPDQRWMVMGDMAELGDMAADMHADIGAYAKQQGVDRLFTLGALSAHASAAFGQGASHFHDIKDLLTALQSQVQAGDSILIKGSRSAKMERVTQAMQQHNQAEGESPCY